ncbi:hypothetical protein HF999_21110 [Tsukamurella spumae]|uniref:Uncharacterized protein n=1 Tax=Tsukamurella spumae TaxID=44753 RepID=A0A846X9B6_9ACTN|nr:hypothetical protein [Tsukamurella spumae]NKY20859.1 hypothetical protein [Tsukamurella spumae]
MGGIVAGSTKRYCGTVRISPAQYAPSEVSSYSSGWPRILARTFRSASSRR